MKTYAQFAKEMESAVANVQEAKGFTPSKKRRKKDEFKSKRDKKVQKLKSNPNHWSGLEAAEEGQ